MAQNRSLKRGRVVPILVAGGIGYLLGGWHVTALRSTDVSPSQSVVQRFPREWDDAQALKAAAEPATAEGDMADNGNAQSVLLSPEPMIPRPVTEQASPPQAAGLPASGEAPAPAPDAAPQAPPTPGAAQNASDTKPVLKVREIKPAAALTNRRTDRPGYVLNDAQIANIKRRLNLTPDQERMWPAVEVALRNLSYTTAHNANGRRIAADTTQLASLDPDSVQVQDFKSAAIPLIMSFNAQQKDEARSLAHIMGLDQLASQL
jgi:hypothetical protein